MANELPDNVVNPYAPAGTPPAAAAHPGVFYCAHGHRWEWVPDVGGYLPMIIEADEMHPGDIPVSGQGALPALCQPATAAGPGRLGAVRGAAPRRRARAAPRHRSAEGSSTILTANLLYPGEPGCAAVRRLAGGQPTACGADPVGTVSHSYRFPRPHVARLLVCAAHSHGLDVLPLDDADRAELVRRRRERAQAYTRRDASR